MNIQNVLPRDAISSIDDPSFSSEYFGAPTDRMLVVEATPARAYPVRILSYHEIVNDRIEGRPIVVTWCPICWSAVVYEGTVDGRELTFGVSGKLADDALVMYDRETESEWKQPTGEAIAGALKGHRLTPVAGHQMTFQEFVDRYSDGVVLAPPSRDGTDDTDLLRNRYDMDRYQRYLEGPGFGLAEMRGEGRRRSWERDDIDAKTVVFGVESGGEAVGYPRPFVVDAGGVITDTVGDMDIVVVVTRAGLFAYEDPGYSYRLGEEGLLADETTWDPITGTATDGRTLDRVRGRQMFAFAWQDAHGVDAFYIPNANQ